MKDRLSSACRYTLSRRGRAIAVLEFGKRLYPIAQRGSPCRAILEHYAWPPRSVPAARRVMKESMETMTNSSTAARSMLIRQLQELVVALDQRVPYVERSGEAAIAHDAATLREKALRRIAELADLQTDARHVDR
jgi:hypothetical protein